MTAIKTESASLGGSDGTQWSFCDFSVVIMMQVSTHYIRYYIRALHDKIAKS